MARDGVDWDAVELDEGGTIPPLEPYDALWVMGGAMDVWDVDEHPWLIDEKRAIRRWVREIAPPLPRHLPRPPAPGRCAGRHLRAAAAARGRRLRHQLDRRRRTRPAVRRPRRASAKALQWHSVRVAQPPEGALVLASSPLCRSRRCGSATRAWGLQYHVEAEAEAVRDWACVPGLPGRARGEHGSRARMDRLADRDARPHAATISTAQCAHDLAEFHAARARIERVGEAPAMRFRCRLPIFVGLKAGGPGRRQRPWPTARAPRDRPRAFRCRTGDPAILARRQAIIDGLLRLLPPEKRHRQRGRAPGLRDRRVHRLSRRCRSPSSCRRPTEEVAAVLSSSAREGVPVIPRGAGTSLAGGALPQADAVVVGLAKMNRVLELRLEDRLARVQAGITNLGISGAVAHERFFYAPDPSSQLACTIAGNIAMNSGGAHCLKYGVTTNNILGVRLVTIDGDDSRHRRRCAWTPTAMTCSASSSARRASSASSPRRPCASCRWRRARGPCWSASPRPRRRGAASPPSSAPASFPVAIEYMDKPAIEITEAFAHAGYPLDVEAMLIIEVEGSRRGDRRRPARSSPTSRAHTAPRRSGSRSRRPRAPRSGKAANRPSAPPAASPTISAWTAPSRRGSCRWCSAASTRSPPGHGLRVANVFHAGDGNLHPLVLYNVNDAGERAEGRGLRLRHPASSASRPAAA